MDIYKKKLRPFFDAQFARLDRNFQQKYKGGRGKLIPEDSQVKTFIAEAIGYLMDCVPDQKDEEQILVSLYSQFEMSHNAHPQLPDRFQNARVIERSEEEMRQELEMKLREEEQRARDLLARQLQNKGKIDAERLDRMVQEAYAQVKKD